jgi:hypothetical protein
LHSYEQLSRNEFKGVDEGTAMDTTTIRPGMVVFGACGNRLGKVECLDGRLIKLREDGPDGGSEHFVPLAWVGRIDQAVYLCGEIREGREEATKTLVGV